MCERLGQLRHAMGRYAASFDAALLSYEDAADVVAEVAAIESLAATVKGLAAARAVGGEGWKVAGDRSGAHHLARTTGSSVREAADVLESGRRLDALPVLAAAARAGELSASQVAAVAGGCDCRSVRRGPAGGEGSQRFTGGAAGGVRPCQGRRPSRRLMRRKAIHDQRFLRSWTDAEGAWHLRVRDNPEVGAEVIAAIEAIRDRLFRMARAEGRHEPSEAYGADALAELARGSGAGGSRQRSRAKIIVRVDLPALLRGQVAPGETCELAGFGPVAVSAIRELLDTGDPFLAAVVTRGRQVVGVAHLGRRANAAQQTALEWLYPTCAAEGCSSLAWLENDHRIDWATSHTTVLDLLDRLCSHHHDLKTTDNWALVEGHGKRPFVPPDDPRHRSRPAAAA